MSSQLKNLSQTEGSIVPSAKEYKFGIVSSEWNYNITSNLTYGAIQTLKTHEVKDDNIFLKWVPGSFELTLGAQYMAEFNNVDAIICIGCVIKGETKHFDFICNAVANGITTLNIEYNMPVIFGVLTPDTIEQALERAGGKHGNKGDEAAITAIKMLALRDSFKKGTSNKIGF